MKISMKMCLRLIFLLRVILLSSFLLFSSLTQALEPRNLPLYPIEEEQLEPDHDNKLESAIHSLKHRQKMSAISKLEVLPNTILLSNISLMQSESSEKDSEKAAQTNQQIVAQNQPTQVLAPQNITIPIQNPIDLFQSFHIQNKAEDDLIQNSDKDMNNVNQAFTKEEAKQIVENKSAQDFFSKGKVAALKTLDSIFNFSNEVKSKPGLEKSNSFLQGFKQLQPLEKYFLLGMAFLSLLLFSFTIIILMRYRRFKLQFEQAGKEIPKETIQASLEAYLEANALASNNNIDTIQDAVKQDGIKININQQEDLQPKWDRFNNLLVENPLENQAAEINITASKRETKDEMSLRLTLAETYLEMADKENALLLLKEVQQKGNATEKALAEKLLAKY